MTGRYSAKKTKKSHGFAANLSRISIDFLLAVVCWAAAAAVRCGAVMC